MSGPDSRAVARAWRLLGMYAGIGVQPSRTDLIDALADLRHYALAYGIDINTCFRVSGLHFEAETSQGKDHEQSSNPIR